MRHWKIILSYDGTPYHGWQIQPGLPTIQGTLAAAIYRITGETVLPQGSGRTDSGVHALAQVASFPLNAPLPAANLQRALNHALPASIRVLAVDPVAPDFHARHSAVRKTYEYRIFAGKRICSPLLAPFVWACGFPLDLRSLNEAAACVIGTHDFTSFAASDPDLAARSAADPAASEDRKQNLLRGSASESTEEHTEAVQRTSTTRTVFESCWRAHEDLLLYQVTGSGFLHHMVRNLVGAFVEAGAHRISPGSIREILLARDRSAAARTAPARGLFLVQVFY